MPEIKQMFPGKYLSFNDLETGRLYEWTIKTVQLESAKASNFGSSYGQQQPAAVEQRWLLFFHEFPKPMVLKPSKAEKISIILGASNTDKWLGSRLRLYRGSWVNGNQSGEGLMIDDRPIAPSAGPALAAGSGLVNLNEKRPIPRSAIGRFLETAKYAGSSWDGFLMWCKSNAPEAISLAWGVELDAIPGGVLPAMKAFLNSLQPAKPAAAPGPAAGEVIDRGTGEVIKPAGGPPAQDTVDKSWIPPTPADFPADDIPF